MKKVFVLLILSLLLSLHGNAQTNVEQNGNSKKKSSLTRKIKVFPNPVTNVVNILGLINSNRARIVISNISGNTVLQHQWAIHNNAIGIPVPNLNAGIYVVRIESEEQQIQTKFY